MREIEILREREREREIERERERERKRENKSENNNKINDCVCRLFSIGHRHIISLHALFLQLLFDLHVDQNQ